MGQSKRLRAHKRFLNGERIGSIYNLYIEASLPWTPRFQVAANLPYRLGFAAHQAKPARALRSRSQALRHDWACSHAVPDQRLLQTLRGLGGCSEWGPAKPPLAAARSAWAMQQGLLCACTLWPGSRACCWPGTKVAEPPGTLHAQHSL